MVSNTKKTKRISREEQAHLEVGTTNIKRIWANIVIILFLCIIMVTPLIETRVTASALKKYLQKGQKNGASKENKTSPTGIKEKNDQLIKKMRALENFLEENSFLRDIFLPPIQYTMLKYLKTGNDKVVLGKDEYLFYSVALNYLTGPPFLDQYHLKKRSTPPNPWEEVPQPDPVKAIVDFKQQLSEQSIELLLLPIPVKASLEPEHLVSEPVTPPLHNRSYHLFIERLKEKGVNVFPTGTVFAEFKKEGDNLFLLRDTHWTPSAMEYTADKLADYIKNNFMITTGTNNYHLQSQKVSSHGDITRMLNLPEEMQLFPKQEVVVNQVLTINNEYWQPDKESQILLLGDSFTNIYSLRGLGWSFAAGLAEHLSYNLSAGVDRIAKNDGGAYSARKQLASQLARGRNRLANKKLIIWEFTERELSSGNWQLIKMQLKEKAESDFYVIEEGREIIIKAMVEDISASPKPGTVPYTDNIVTIHLTDIKAENEELTGGQMLVYGWGMRNNKLTPLATVRPGDEIRVKISSWAEKESEYDGYRRSPLDDETMELETPNWGELLNENK